MEPNTIHCPKCNSTQLHFAKKGFSGKKAVVGGILTGGLGLFAGTIGSNKILANCMSCGNQFSPSELKPTPFVSRASLFNLEPTIEPTAEIAQKKPITKAQKITVMVMFSIITVALTFILISKMATNGFSFLLFVLLLLISATFSVAHSSYMALNK